MDKNVLEKKNKMGGISLHDFKIYFISIGIRLWYWWRDRQRSTKQNTKPQNSPHPKSTTHLVLTKTQI